jgi:hypothetical protein
MTLAQLDVRKCRLEGCISLHLAIDCHIRTRFLSDVTGQFHRSRDFFCGCRAGAAFGGKAQKSNTRAVSEDLPGQQTGLNSDGRKLRHRGVWNHARVGEKQNTIFAVRTVEEIDNRAG